jgi:hypothetical protein
VDRKKPAKKHRMACRLPIGVVPPVLMLLMHPVAY